MNKQAKLALMRGFIFIVEIFREEFSLWAWQVKLIRGPDKKVNSDFNSECTLEVDIKNRSVSSIKIYRILKCRLRSLLVVIK